MSRDHLEIQLDKTHYKPKDLVKGHVNWQCENSPKELRIYLAWETDGRGTQDSKSEGEFVIENPASSGKEYFSLELPASPYSFSGTLIHLGWYVEARAKKGDGYSKVDIQVGPNEQGVKI